MTRLDLADVLDYIGVTYRTGRREVKVRCPVHGDRDPSMNVNLRDGLVHCHACGWGGNALQLLMEVEGCDAESGLALAAKNGIGTLDAEEGSGSIPLGYMDGRRLPGSKRDKRTVKRYIPPWGRR